MISLCTKMKYSKNYRATYVIYRFLLHYSCSHIKQSGIITLDYFSISSSGGQIPDANMIHAIRKQRQQARERGDMIPLDDTVRWVLEFCQ